MTSGASLTSVADTYLDDATTSTSPNGSKPTVLEMASDPRWSLSASYAKSVRSDVGSPTTTHSMTMSETRSATLSSPNDPLSVTGLTTTSTRTGTGLPTSTVTRVFSAGPPAKWVTTTGAGRQFEETLDALDRTTQVAALGTTPVALHPMQYRYDTRSRVDRVTWGTHIDTTYDPSTGWITATTAPEGVGVTTTARDPAGRPLSMTLPGGRILGLGYDLSGNMTSVVPPSQPAHTFSFDPNDRLGECNLGTTQVYMHVSSRRLKEIHAATHPGAVLGRRAAAADADEPGTNDAAAEELISSFSRRSCRGRGRRGWVSGRLPRREGT